ncbi:MAG: hypothetical protein CML29_15175 [Rhizobiales bacterium]|nr:hypothetical protein [Hyphomicrobiales bacterium]
MSHPRSETPPRTSGFAGTWAIPIVYAVAVLARSSIIIVIPTLAFDSLGAASLVSVVYLTASGCGLVMSMAAPQVLQSIGPWGVTILASISGLAAALMFCVPGPATLIAGLALHFLMVQLFETATNVYALNTISRRDLARFEPRRIMLAGFAYIAGPAIGALLLAHGASWSPFLLSGLCVVLVPFLVAGLVPNARYRAPPSIVAVRGGFAVRQFLRQPRLRLAWMLAIGRAGWWQMFFVYTPILAAIGGIGVGQTGTIASAASALLLLAPLWGLVLRKLGLRRFMFLAYATCGAATALAGLLAGWSFGWAAAALIVSAIAISGVDSAGNTPFMRAVRIRDRTRMVPIYNTYREMSQLVPAMVYAVLLTTFGVGSVFIVSGLALGVMSIFCRRLPRRA